MRASSRQSKEVSRACGYCGDEFWVWSKRAKQVCCSHSCAAMLMTDKVDEDEPRHELVCKQCKKKFNKPITEYRMFCTDRCAT